MEKYNFFEAYRLAVTENRRLRLASARHGFRDWCSVDITGNHATLIFGEGSFWWPTPEEMKRKSWEVESAATSVRICEGLELCRRGGKESIDQYLKFISSSGSSAIIQIADIKSEIISMVVREWAKDRFDEADGEESPESDDDIFVWGACDDDEGSFLYAEKPALSGSKWGAFGGIKCLRLRQDDLFPKDEPVKLRLVPANLGVLKWMPCVADKPVPGKLNEKSFDFLIKFSDGVICSATWNETGFACPLDADIPIEYYCILDNRGKK